jgi:hypothetical protein
MKEVRYYGLCYFEGPEVRDAYFVNKETAFNFVKRRVVTPNSFQKIFIKNNEIFVVKFALNEGEYIKYDASKTDPDDITYRYGFIYKIKSIMQYVARDGKLILKDKNAKLYLNPNECYTDNNYLFYDKSIDISHPDQFCIDWHLDEKEFSDKKDETYNFPFIGVIISTDISEIIIKLMEGEDE